MTYACDIPFLFSTFITPSEKHSANLSASSSSHGLVIVISGRSLYDAVAMERRDNIHCLTPCVRTSQKLPPSREMRFSSQETRRSSLEKRLSSLEMKLSSREMRLSSRECFQKRSTAAWTSHKILIANIVKLTMQQRCSGILGYLTTTKTAVTLKGYPCGLTRLM